MIRSSGDEAHAPFALWQRVDDDVKYRPLYLEAILDLLDAECGLSESHVVADIGSGPGILAELFFRHGNRLYGLEPEPEMRAGAEYALRQYANFGSVAATAGATTLPERSVDFVTAGQVFHRFDLAGARREFSRTLAPGGRATSA